MESEWDPVPTEDEIKTYFETETDFMPINDYYTYSFNLEIRKSAVSEIATNWKKLSEDDAFVPYLAMNYFDNFVSHLNSRFEIKWDKRALPNWVFLHIGREPKPNIDVENLLEEKFAKIYGYEFKRVEYWFDNKGERLKQPVTPFCFLSCYSPSFENIKRCCIDEIIVQAQGEEDFIGYKPSEIALSSFRAASHIANPSMAPDSHGLKLNPCDEKFYHLYQKKEIEVETSRLEADPSSNASTEMPKEQPEEVETSEIETKIDEAASSSTATAEIHEEQPKEVASFEIEKKIEVATTSSIATAAIPKEQPKEVGSFEIEKKIEAASEIEKKIEEATPSSSATAKIPKEQPKDVATSEIEKKIEEATPSSSATAKIPKEQPKEVATSEIEKKIEEATPSSSATAKIPKEQPKEVATSEIEKKIEEATPSSSATATIPKEQPKEVASFEIEKKIEEATPSSSATAAIHEERPKEVATSETETESERQRRVKGKAVAEIVEEQSPYNPLRYCPKRLTNFELQWPMDDPLKAMERKGRSGTEVVRNKNCCCCFRKL